MLLNALIVDFHVHDQSSAVAQHNGLRPILLVAGAHFFGSLISPPQFIIWERKRCLCTWRKGNGTAWHLELSQLEIHMHLHNCDSDLVYKLLHIASQQFLSWKMCHSRTTAEKIKWCSQSRHGKRKTTIPSFNVPTKILVERTTHLASTQNSGSPASSPWPDCYGDGAPPFTEVLTHDS